MNRQDKARLAALDVRIPNDPGLTLQDERDKRIPASAWVKHDLHQGEQDAVPQAPKPGGLQPPKPGDTIGRPHKPRSKAQPSKLADLIRPENAPLLLKAAEACRLLSVSAKTLTRLEERGLLRSIKLVRHKLYPTNQITDLVAKLQSYKP